MVSIAVSQVVMVVAYWGCLRTAKAEKNNVSGGEQIDARVRKLKFIKKGKRFESLVDHLERGTTARRPLEKTSFGLPIA
ncbi:hypothetical protein L2E82_09179 [Cichorium intybus]|uniref:Uncharacterized protein n=1 Tax=Cichorium intybus TaxID=13427 RepID=A0ACB9G7R1_CICIN|nr:hypothetical protein L2E82_09179 [Cichorium intybus]